LAPPRLALALAVRAYTIGLAAIDTCKGNGRRRRTIGILDEGVTVFIKLDRLVDAANGEDVRAI
jgi:hypothetical protein